MQASLLKALTTDYLKAIDVLQLSDGVDQARQAKLEEFWAECYWFMVLFFIRGLI